MKTLRHAIFSGALQPGDPILELHLAREHGVSQTTVREALVKLEHAGFVRRIPNKGTFVTKLDPRELREHLRLRVVLEGLAAVDAARSMTTEDFKELDRHLGNIAKAVHRNDYFEASQADLEFHRYIWGRSRDKTLCRTLDQVTSPLFAFVSIRRSGNREDLTRVVRSHEPIVAALKEGDPEAIREAIRCHIESSYVQFLNSGLEDFQVLAQAAP